MEIIIELNRPQRFGIDDESGKQVLQQAGNGDFYIEPLGENRRGRWLKNQMHSDWPDSNKIAKAAPEELPGYHVSVDIKARRVRVYDPLHGSAKGEDVARRFESIGLAVRLEKPKVFDGLGEPQLWVWLKWMFRVVRDGNAEVVGGEFPKAVAQRIEQEREWDMAADPNTGKRHWEKEPSLDDNGSRGPKEPAKAA